MAHDNNDSAKQGKEDYDREVLSFIEELATVAERISLKLSEKLENKLRKARKKITDDDMFVCMFLRRTVTYGKSIGLLTRKGFYHEATIIARTVLEGLFYFQYYVYNTGLAKRWRLFAIYEDCINAGNYAKDATLEGWRKAVAPKYGPVTDEAIQEFQLDDTLANRDVRWYPHKGIAELIKGINNEDARKDARKLYINLYPPFSRIIHWTIFGMGDTHVQINAALAVTFQGLYVMSKQANEMYHLGADEDLTDLHNRYRSKGVQNSLI